MTSVTNISLQKRKTGVKTEAGAMMATEREEEAEVGSEVAEAGEALGDVE